MGAGFSELVGSRGRWEEEDGGVGSPVGRGRLGVVAASSRGAGGGVDLQLKGWALCCRSQARPRRALRLRGGRSGHSVASGSRS